MGKNKERGSLMNKTMTIEQVRDSIYQHKQETVKKETKDKDQGFESLLHQEMKKYPLGFNPYQE